MLPWQVGFFAGQAGPDWSLVGQDSQSQDASSGANNISLPGGTSEGDIVIVVVGADSATVEGLTSSGYTEIYNTTTGVPEMQVWYKIMGGTPDTVVEITNDSTFKSVAIVQVWRGVNQTTPIDDTRTVAEGTGIPNPPSFTTVTDGALVFAVGAIDDIDISATITAPSGYTNLLAADCGIFNVNGGATVMMASMLKATAGAENPAAFGGTGSDDWDAITFALRPPS